MAQKPCIELDARNVVTVLLVLRMTGRVNMTELREYVSNYSSLRTCVHRLHDIDLVRLESVEQPRHCTKVSLTEKGVVVAEHLQISADIIHGTIDIEEDLS